MFIHQFARYVSRLNIAVSFFIGMFCFGGLVGLYAREATEDAPFAYTEPIEEKLRYKVTNTYSYEYHSEDVENNLITKKLHSEVTVHQPSDKGGNFVVEIELLDLEVLDDITEPEISPLGEDRKISFEFRRDSSGLLDLTPESEQAAKKMGEEGVRNLTLFGRAARGFFVTRFNLPGEDVMKDSTQCYEWKSNLVFGMATRSTLFRAFPLGEYMVITGVTLYDDDKKTTSKPLSRKAEKLSALFQDGVIVHAEYRLHFAGRDNIVKANLVSQ